MQKHKDYIRNILLGFENSLRVKGLIDILNKIDSNTDILESDIHRQCSIYINKALVTLKNKGRSGQVTWLQNNVAYILRLLYTYRMLLRHVYKADKSLLNWYRVTTENESLYWKMNDIRNANIYHNMSNLGNIMFEYEGLMYSIESFPPNDTMSVTHIEIASFGDEHAVSFSYNFEDTNSASEIPQRQIICNCSCSSCPRWKQSVEKSYSDGYKPVVCSVDDCNKCSGYEQNGLLRPRDCEDIYKALFLCINSRETNSDSNSSDKEYEHIPRPMRTDDVVIYFGESNTRAKDFVNKFAINNDKTMSPIVGSHASPREHERRGGTRRGYTRKDGTKVKPTTFKATTVNKGFTKTTYRLKERKQ